LYIIILINTFVQKYTMARIISIANIKGGVGKTSTSIFLATAFAHKGYKVLYLDCDSQASAYTYRNYEKSMDLYKDIEEPYRVRKTDPSFIFEVIEDNRATYDIIFIDLPRLTREEDDTKIAMILALCDSVLIPCTSGELDNMSTLEFVKILKRIEERKMAKNRPFQIGAFQNMTGRVPTEDIATKEFMEHLGVHIFKNQIKNLKRFSAPYTYDSLLATKATRELFEPFYLEFVKFFKLDY